MLAEWLPAQIFSFFLVFCRVGAGLMLMPGFGEIYVSPRIRLLLALAMSLAVLPVAQHALPPLPTRLSTTVGLLGAELMVGILFGTIARMMISATHVAGTVIATQSGLASAMMLDMTQSAQSTVVANVISVTAMTVLFASDLHHLLLRGLADSYTLFAPGAFPSPVDMAQHAMRMATRAFTIGMQMASPIIVVGLLLYLGAGVLSRLMPTMQIFFILMAPQILLTFFVLMVILPGIMMWYMGMLEETFGNIFAPPG